MASPNLEISSNDVSPAMMINNDGSVITACHHTLNPSAPPVFFPSLWYNWFPLLPPPVYYFSGETFLFPPPPPQILIPYQVWYLNPNPNNRVESIQQEQSPNPSQELSHSPPANSKSTVIGPRGDSRRRINGDVDHLTTVMIRNIPNRYTRKMMIDFMDNYCEEANKEKNEEFPISAYDFLYLPIDFKTKMNKGYAFVNFTNPKVISKFKAACDHKAWSVFYSKKVLEIAYAKIQGKNALMRHFEQMIYPVEAYGAVCFEPPRSGKSSKARTIIVGKCTGRMIYV